LQILIQNYSSSDYQTDFSIFNAQGAANIKISFLIVLGGLSKNQFGFFYSPWRSQALFLFFMFA